MIPALTLTRKYLSPLHKLSQTDLSLNLRLYAVALVCKISHLLLRMPSLHPARVGYLGNLPHPSSLFYPLLRFHYQFSMLPIVVPVLACRASAFQEFINELALAQTFCLIQPGLPRFLAVFPVGPVRGLLASLLKVTLMMMWRPKVHFPDQDMQSLISHVPFVGYPALLWVLSCPCLLSQLPLLRPCFLRKGCTLYA